MLYKIDSDKIIEGNHQMIKASLNALEVMVGHDPLNVLAFMGHTADYFLARKRAGKGLGELKESELRPYDEQARKLFIQFAQRVTDTLNKPKEE